MQYKIQENRYRHSQVLLANTPCYGKTDLFFSDKTKDIKQAQLICALCPMRQQCLETARANPPYAGVWGGVVFIDGDEQLFKRGRGRPSRREGHDRNLILDALGIKEQAS